MEAEPYEFSEARKYTGLYLEGIKASLRYLQRRIAADNAEFTAFIRLFHATVKNTALAQTVASFNAVLLRAYDFIDNIARLNYTNTAMVGTDDGNRTAVSSQLSPTTLKKTPLFYAAQDAYVKGFVVITDSLLKLLSCRDCADTKNRGDLANNELLSKLFCFRPPLTDLSVYSTMCGGRCRKSAQLNPEEVLTPLQVHYRNGLMTALTQYAEKHQLTST
ncbi:MAG: hypothetical protein ACR5LG_02945 [Sodalis sp. (in: enterobacteria)]|uniref:hypothetical protein n=1 Tax=Sodalis sp. (in: enterobacteria) TaxID=1898979 RepID=UPI003F2CF43E